MPIENPVHRRKEQRTRTATQSSRRLSNQPSSVPSPEVFGRMNDVGAFLVQRLAGYGQIRLEPIEEDWNTQNLTRSRGRLWEESVRDEHRGFQPAVVVRFRSFLEILYWWAVAIVTLITRPRPRGHA